MFQLEKQQKELKEATSDDIEVDSSRENDDIDISNDDLAPYLPDVNSIESSQLLETCVLILSLKKRTQLRSKHSKMMT